jgi:nitronate monooxygenase
VVSSLGGLGSFGAHHLNPESIVATVAAMRERTDMPFAINLWISNEDPEVRTFSREAFARTLEALKPYFAELGVPLPEYPNTTPAPVWGQRYDEQIKALLESAPPVFSFVYGVPDASVLQECRTRGIKTIGTATTPEEAKHLEAAGVDAVVATGFEAGGHRVSFLRSAEDSFYGTFSLVPLVREAVKIPVIAAGGIANGRSVSAALQLGADGVQIGTAFLACKESAASDTQRSAMFSPMSNRTALTRVFTGRLARSLNTDLVEALRRPGTEYEPAPYPIQSWIMAHLKEAAARDNRPDRMSLWSGQCAPLLRHRTAPELFDSLVTEMNQLR